MDQATLPSYGIAKWRDWEIARLPLHLAAEQGFHIHVWCYLAYPHVRSTSRTSDIGTTGIQVKLEHPV